MSELARTPAHAGRRRPGRLPGQGGQRVADGERAGGQTAKEELPAPGCRQAPASQGCLSTSISPGAAASCFLRTCPYSTVATMDTSMKTRTVGSGRGSEKVATAITAASPRWRVQLATARQVRVAGS